MQCLSFVIQIKLELELGRVLGRGGFCVVNEIKAFNLNGAVSQNTWPSMKEYETREAMSKRCMRDNESRYAVKRLLEDSHTNPGLFLKGTVDLAIEARFLSVMEHPHLIKMRGIGSAGPFADGYFVILDRLYDTLETRVRKWKSALKKAKGILGSVSGGKTKVLEITAAKIGAAHDIASAMSYIHSFNIIYRDLKPDNLGFDIRGEIKIFDLGLAKELKESQKLEDDTYKLTGFTGSLRYMAPEVAKCLPYNLSADVYSFGMLFWYILEMETPFDAYSCRMHEDRVVEKGYRPACRKSWPEDWSKLMKKSWSHNPKNRYSFDDILLLLRAEVMQLSGDPNSMGVDVSQKSFKHSKH